MLSRGDMRRASRVGRRRLGDALWRLKCGSIVVTESQGHAKVTQGQHATQGKTKTRSGREAPRVEVSAVHYDGTEYSIMTGWRTSSQCPQLCLTANEISKMYF